MSLLPRAAAFALALALPLALAPPPAAAEAALEASVAAAPGVSARPALAAFLRAEDESLVAEMREAAEAERDDASASGFPFRPHDLAISYDLRVDDGRFVSILRSVATYTGGAHGNLFLDPLVWDASARDFVRLDAFLAPGGQGAQGLRAISAALRKALLANDQTWPDSVRMATAPDVAVLQTFTLEPSTVSGRIGGLAFHFAPYEVAPYSEGPQRVVVPQNVFAAYLRPDLRARFAGEPAQ